MKGISYGSSRYGHAVECCFFGLTVCETFMLSSDSISLYSFCTHFGVSHVVYGPRKSACLRHSPRTYFHSECFIGGMTMAANAHPLRDWTSRKHHFQIFSLIGLGIEPSLPASLTASHWRNRSTGWNDLSHKSNSRTYFINYIKRYTCSLQSYKLKVKIYNALQFIMVIKMFVSCRSGIVSVSTYDKNENRKNSDICTFCHSTSSKGIQLKMLNIDNGDYLDLMLPITFLNMR